MIFPKIYCTLCFLCFVYTITYIVNIYAVKNFPLNGGNEEKLLKVHDSACLRSLFDDGYFDDECHCSDTPLISHEEFAWKVRETLLLKFNKSRCDEINI